MNIELTFFTNNFLVYMNIIKAKNMKYDPKFLPRKLTNLMKYSLALFCLFTLSCAADLKADDNESVMEASPTISTELVIDSSSEESWVYFDLDAYLENPESIQESIFDDAENNVDWDIAFQRYQIMSNGGISGSGNVEIAIIKDQDYSTIDKAPSTGYQVDAEDSEEDEDANPDYVFNQADAWYSYDISTHTLKSKAYTYIVKTTQGNYFKIAIDDYYNEVGDSGYLTMRVESVLAP